MTVDGDGATLRLRHGTHPYVWWWNTAERGIEKKRSGRCFGLASLRAIVATHRCEQHRFRCAATGCTRRCTMVHTVFATGATAPGADPSEPTPLVARSWPACGTAPCVAQLNRVASVPRTTENVTECRTCRREQTGRMLACARCRLVRYCSHDCQRTDWKAHRPDCVPYERSDGASRDHHHPEEADDTATVSPSLEAAETKVRVPTETLPADGGRGCEHSGVKQKIRGKTRLVRGTCVGRRVTSASRVVLGPSVADRTLPDDDVVD